jgi:hypothetical protein
VRRRPPPRLGTRRSSGPRTEPGAERVVAVPPFRGEPSSTSPPRRLPRRRQVNDSVAQVTAGLRGPTRRKRHGFGEGQGSVCRSRLWE